MKHRGLTAAVLVSVLLHAVVLGLIIWKKSPPAHETAAVEAVEVELVEETGEEETQIPNLDLSLDAVTAAEEAALAQKQGNEQSSESEEAPAAEETSKTEAAGEAEAAETAETETAAAETAESTSAEAESAEAEAEPSEVSEAEPVTEQAQEQEQEPESAATEDDTAGNAPGAETAGGPPPTPVPLAVGTPTTLYGDAGSGAEGAALPADVAAEETAAPPAPNENETGTSDTAGTEQAEEADMPQETEAAAAQSAPAPAEDAAADADEPAQDAPVAAVSDPAPGEATWGSAADTASDAMQAPQDAPEAAAAANEVPPAEEPADTPAEATPLEDTLADSELAATTPSDQPGFALPLPKPQRQPSEVVGTGATPAATATSQVSLSDALREALAAGFGGAGEAGRGQVAEVAYTEAVRSAIAPLFFSAMRNVSGSGQVVVAVVIRRDGSVRSAEVVQGSGNTELDRASLYAAKSAPYPALPPDVTSETLTVHIPLRVR